MSRRIARSIRGIVPLAAALVLLAAGSAGAAQFWLRAEQINQTMPDGRVVRMWGFALTDATFVPGTATVPGPALTVPPGEGLTIHLRNKDIPEAVSVIIPGQAAPTDGVNPPTIVRTGGRATSFTHETAMGGENSYVWTPIRPGTYLYQSGSHPAVQVQMGLYGALENDETAGDAYGDPTSLYAQDLVLLYSEIDPALHDAVAGGQYGPGKAVTSTANYDPRYFLVNGQPYEPGRSPLPLGTAGTTLLRFLNAGLETHLPLLGGGPSLALIAEDGNLLPHPRVSHEVELPAGKTADATLDLTGVSPGYYPVYDRRLSLVNDRSAGGGMLVHLAVPDATTATLTVAKDGTGAGTVLAGSAPGGISCGVDCTETYNAGTTVVLKGVPAPGSLLTGWTGGGCSGTGDCVTTVSGAATVTATFTALTKVKVLAPAAGTVVPAGSVFTISWAAPPSAVRYRVQLSTTGGLTWTTLAANVPGQTRYVWRVPVPAGNLTRCKVRVTAWNAANVSLGTASSDGLFTIETVRLVAPNGGEVLTGGTVFPVTWKTNATRYPVTVTRLYWSPNNGLTWALVTSLPGNPGVYDWTLPVRAAALTGVRARVVLFAGSTVVGSDVSNARFTIQPAP
jgi:FtsP/CotA-like multicopper oxidase with cupredoxin domain